MFELEEKMRERHETNRFMVHNFAELESVEPDRAVVKLEIRDESKNPAGMVHGGADSSSTATIRTPPPARQ